MYECVACNCFEIKIQFINYIVMYRISEYIWVFRIRLIEGTARASELFIGRCKYICINKKIKNTKCTTKKVQYLGKHCRNNVASVVLPQ